MTKELVQWFRAQPFSTKWLTVASLLVPVFMKLRILSPSILVFYWPDIWKKFQLWRMITSLFLSRVDFSFLLSLYFRSQYSFYLETIQFAGRPADYFYFLCLAALLINILNVYLQLAVLWESFSMAIVYVWAQYNKAVTVNFMFGFRFPAIYLPVVMAGMDFLLGGNFYGTLLGILVGHLYYFLKEIYSRTNPNVSRILEAPLFFTIPITILITIPNLSNIDNEDRKNAIPNYISATSQNFSGFSVQAPRDPATGMPAKTLQERNATTATVSNFAAFSGKANKLGS